MIDYNVVLSVSSILFSNAGILVTVYIGFIAVLGYFSPSVIRKLMAILAWVFLLPFFSVLIAIIYSCVPLAYKGGIINWFAFSFILTMGLSANFLLWLLVKLIFGWVSYRVWENSKEDKTI